MKTILIAFLALTICSSMCYAQRTFNFKIDQKDYSIDEKTLNDLFGNAFNDLIERKWTDNSHFSLWVKSYSDWKDESVKGIWIWDTIGDRISSNSFYGNMPAEYLGWKAPGKDATGNPNKKSNISRRMRFINISLSRQLIYYFTHKAIVN